MNAFENDTTNLKKRLSHFVDKVVQSITSNLQKTLK